MKKIMVIPCLCTPSSCLLLHARKININLKNYNYERNEQFHSYGYVCKDAEVKNFEKAAIARFGIIIKHTERKGNESTTVSSIIGLETWVKNDDTATLELLKKGKEITVEGFFKPENYTKDGKNVTVLKNIATKVTAFVREEKQDAPKAKNKKAK